MVRCSDQLRYTVDRIKRLEVQGARNIMRVGLLSFISELRYTTPKDYRKRMQLAHKLLVSARPTEPFLINVLDLALNIIQTHDYEQSRELLDLLLLRVNDRLIENKERMTKHGVKIITENGYRRIMTICHSSSVVSVLIGANRRRKIEVYSCETRPRWQGRITARELSAHQVKVNMIVDGAMGHYIDDVDAVFVGCDAVDRRGNFVNKVGTRALGQLARDHKIPLYVVGELFKADKRYPIPIEMRPPDEIADPREFPGVNILNPAFDYVERKYVKEFITETGVIRPSQFYSTAMKELKRLITF